MGIDVQHPSLRVRDRLGPRPHGHGPAGLADHAVGIGHHEPRLVRRVGLQVEDASGEHVRRDDVELRPHEDPLTLEAQERERRRPDGLALPAIRDIHRGVAVVVAWMNLCVHTIPGRLARFVCFLIRPEFVCIQELSPAGPWSDMAAPPPIAIPPPGPGEPTPWTDSGSCPLRTRPSGSSSGTRPSGFMPVPRQNCESRLSAASRPQLLSGEPRPEAPLPRRRHPLLHVVDHLPRYRPSEPRQQHRRHQVRVLDRPWPHGADRGPTVGAADRRAW